MNQNRSSSNESGNALFMILIGVVLFAALSFTFTRNNQQSADVLTQRQTELAASDIVTYAQRVSRTVDSMLSKGYSETQISFEGMESTVAYANTGCTEPNCKVFGGSTYGIQQSIPVDSWLDDVLHKNDYAFKKWYITSQYCVPYLPEATTCSGGKGNDLILILPYLKKSLCEMINTKLHLPAPATVGAVGTIDAARQFNGAFNVSSAPLPDAALNRKSAGCIYAGGGYYFFQVLIER